MTNRVPGHMLRELDIPASSVIYSPAGSQEVTVQEALDRVIDGGGGGGSWSDPSKLDVAGGKATGEIYYDSSVATLNPRALVDKSYTEETYLPKAGGEVSGPISYASGVTPTDARHLATKAYVDSKGGGNEGPVPEIRLAVIGDSLAAQNHAMAPSWPTLMEEALRTSQINAKVFNFAVPAATFYTAVNVENNGATQLEKAISTQPHIVIVSLGINETLNAVGSLTYQQMVEARDQLFSTLRTSLPDAKIVYMDQRPYDMDKYTLSVSNPLPNKATMLYYFKLRTSGILANCFTSEILDDIIDTTVLNRVMQWYDLRYPLADNSPQRDVAGVFNLWRIARMGGCVYDGLHLTAAGQVLMRGYVMKALQSPVLSELLPGLTTNPTPNVNDPDAIFDSMFTYNPTTKDYSYTGTVANAMGMEDSLYSSLRPHNWFLPRDVKWEWSHSGSKPLRLGLDAVFVRSISGAKPDTNVQISVNGSAWSPSSDYTNRFGNQVSGNDAISLAAYANTPTVFRYRVDNIICDPLNLSITTANGHSMSITSNTSLTPVMARGINSNTTNNTYSITVPHSDNMSLPIGIPVRFSCAGSGGISFNAESGVVIHKRPGVTMNVMENGGYAELIQISTNVWSLHGDLKT